MALHTRLKTGKEAEYESVHAVIPPELDTALREAGVHSWRIWRDAPGFNQRFTGTFDDAGTTITGAWEMSEDGTTWSKDFDLVYRKR